MSSFGVERGNSLPLCVEVETTIAAAREVEGFDGLSADDQFLVLNFITSRFNYIQDRGDSIKWDEFLEANKAIHKSDHLKVIAIQASIRTSELIRRGRHLADDV